jgi:hypothetical protein
MAQPQRACNDMGLERTIAWLAKWYGDTDDLQIEHVPIHCPDVASLCGADAKRLDRLRSKNQSELHAYLKFAAWKWLEGASAFPDTIEPEVLCYSPIEELCEGRIFTDECGREEDIRTPQVLYDNPDNFPLDCGHAIRIDLHSFDISVEVGGTQPFNLLTPLLDALVEQAVWLPYPCGKDVRTFRHSAGGLGVARAYSVRFRD